MSTTASALTNNDFTERLTQSTHSHTHTLTHIHTLTHTHILTHTHTYSHSHTLTHTHTYSHSPDMGSIVHEIVIVYYSSPQNTNINLLLLLQLLLT